MSRPVLIQDEAILEAARKVFLAHGYKASTRQVAREAGVSEGSVFRRFRNKTDLFVAAMDAEISGQSWQALLAKSVGTGDLRQTLEAAGSQILEHMRTVLPRIMMIRSSGILLAGSHRCGASGLPHPIRKLHALADYFRAEVKCGRLVMRNPEVHAQIFLGTVTHYAFQETMFGYRPVAPAVYVRTIVDMILRTTMPATTPLRRPKGVRA